MLYELSPHSLHCFVFTFNTFRRTCWTLCLRWMTRWHGTPWICCRTANTTPSSNFLGPQRSAPYKMNMGLQFTTTHWFLWMAGYIICLVSLYISYQMICPGLPSPYYFCFLDEYAQFIVLTSALLSLSYVCVYLVGQKLDQTCLEIYKGICIQYNNSLLFCIFVLDADLVKVKLTLHSPKTLIPYFNVF